MLDMVDDAPEVARWSFLIDPTVAPKMVVVDARQDGVCGGASSSAVL